MEKFAIILTLFCTLAFAQETPTEPKEAVIIDIDPRCKNAVVWGVSLIVKKENGHTLEDAQAQLAYDYMVGPLKTARPEVLAYMFDIVDVVYTNPTITVPEITQTAIDVNELCVTFMNTPRIEPKPLPLKT